MTVRQQVFGLGVVPTGFLPGLAAQWFTPRQSPSPLRDSSGFAPDSLALVCV